MGPAGLESRLQAVVWEAKVGARWMHAITVARVQRIRSLQADSLPAKLLTVKSLTGCSSPRQSPGPRRSASATGCGFRSGVGCRALLTSRLRAVLARGGCVGSQIAGGGVVGSAGALAQGA